jgi:hypothetical protein
MRAVCTGAMCARWEPHGTKWEVDGAILGCMCHMGATCTIWKPYGSCECHMGAMHAIWEPYGAKWEADGAIWEPFSLYCMVIAPCGSHLHCVRDRLLMRSIWHHMGCTLCHMIAVRAIWEPLVLYGSHVCHMEGGWCHVEAECAILWPYGSLVHHIGGQ